MNLFASLRSRALLVILLATLPLLAGVIDGYRRERAAAIAAIDDQLKTLLRFTLHREIEVVRDIETLLRIMGNAGDMQSPTPASCSGLAARLMRVQPDFVNLGAVWPNGDLFCSALEITRAVNVADRAWFKEVQSARSFTSGYYQVGRMSRLPAVTYGLPQLDATGNVRTALFAAVKLDWFNRLIQGVHLPDDWHALIVTRDGFVAAHYPANLPAGHASVTEVLHLLGDTPAQAVVRAWRDKDGDHRHGIAPLSTTRGELYLIIGADMRLALTPVERRFRYQIGLAVLFALASILLAWFTLRGSVLDWVRQMDEIVLNFGNGRLDARAGIVSSVPELQLLADNFDDMARRVETLTSELEARVAARTAALERSNADLEAFAYSVSHDLRAPLRAICGFSNILNERYRAGLDAEGQRYLEHVKHAADQMNQLIDDLLQYARVGRGAAESSPVALAPLLAEITPHFQSRLDASGGRIEIAAALATPLGDRRLIGQVLTNLIDNALKYQPSGQAPVVSIGAVREGDAVIIRVTDNGIGIPPENRAMIFNVFQRLHGEDDYPGTGIGLAIAHKAARLMNGTLGVESVPGQGSTFILRLPAARPSTASSE